ncbi:MAG: ribonuclease P protein component [Minisyncoccia bacterium]
MLPKKNRVSKMEFGEIFKGGKRYNSEHFLLYLAKNKDKLQKFSFSVSKKVCPKAVQRNKLRRRGYSAISKIVKSMIDGNSGLFVIKKNFSKMSFKALEEEITSLLLKAGVLI